MYEKIEKKETSKNSIRLYLTHCLEPYANQGLAIAHSLIASGLRDLENDPDRENRRINLSISGGKDILKRFSYSDYGQGLTGQRKRWVSGPGASFKTVGPIDVPLNVLLPKIERLNIIHALHLSKKVLVVHRGHLENPLMVAKCVHVDDIFNNGITFEKHSQEEKPSFAVHMHGLNMDIAFKDIVWELQVHYGQVLRRINASIRLNFVDEDNRKSITIYGPASEPALFQKRVVVEGVGEMLVALWHQKTDQDTIRFHDCSAYALHILDLELTLRRVLRSQGVDRNSEIFKQLNTYGGYIRGSFFSVQPDRRLLKVDEKLIQGLKALEKVLKEEFFTNM